MPQQLTTNTKPDLSEKATTLLNHLKDEVTANNGEMYIKGKFISDDVGLSAKEIGALMLQLKEADTDITIEEWSYTSATTWRVTTE